MSPRRAAVAGLLLLIQLATAAGAATQRPGDVGESIYLRGVLSSGAPLIGTREGGLGISGADAACVNCHRRSGLGSAEGSFTIPPVTGQYLFHSRAGRPGEPALPYAESAHGNRDPYTEATLPRAIRDGVDSEGRPLNVLMPHFKLGATEMAALIGYLRGLDGRREALSDAALLHFATIITPDADPVKRQGVLDVIQHYFAEKNSFPFPPSPRMRTSGKTLYSKSMYTANRRWQLHVWELTGPASTWLAQLQQHLRQDPVLAVVSGLGRQTWQPVHEFCERQKLPCLFPNIEVPVIADHDFYSLYFSKGVLLEAGLIASRIVRPTAGATARTVDQIYRTQDSGESAAEALAVELRSHGIAVTGHALPANATAAAVVAAVRSAATGEALVLWLRPGDIAALDHAPTPSTTVFMSGLMGGLERSPLPSSWRGATRLAYPFDLPDNSRVRVDYPLKWFSIQRIPVVAEQVQVDTYLACGFLAETLNHMADNVVPEVLVERSEEMLEHRVLTGYYPRLTLAAGQRFASKGGYLVRLAQSEGAQVIADQEWIVP
jgi:hypothetical protein